MSDPFGERPFPRGVLIAVAILLGSIILMISIARLTGMSPEQIPVAPAVETRDLRFESQPEDVLAVYDDATGELIETFAPVEGGFVRGVLRSMGRERMLHQAEAGAPFQVARRADGAITLEDPETEILIRLRAFGESNEGVFAELLDAEPVSQ
ncbi:phosphonoacetaldehyde hydrolase [Marichromatium purpuratum 984]|uniref:Phosphonoacetaldehyde hydrolase n=2 Tax=Marichromatium TaxID=85076 RepID=W0E265_MARPU|nr:MULTISPECIES: photosynthetic complex assembly protein PuhC [Marichromatium]AHF04827.1 phosphonoacetaldehyde hydrolase [Marichromatium purpuratum 984]KXX65867.1 phosphonoacetaldehyde hydrolase [Marichromatium gracile]